MFANILKKCVHIAKSYKSISAFVFLAQHLQKNGAPISHRETSVRCSNWCHLCVDHKVLGNRFHTRPVSIVFPLSRWIKKQAGDKGLLQQHIFQSPVRNNGCQSSHPSATKSFQALAVNKRSGKSTLAERHKWSTPCSMDSAFKVNQTRTSQNVSVLNMCRHVPSLLCSKQYAVITVS